ncbi:hypothetical protein FRB99_003437 [Tulasnella sp. 403]|nr:hypothetical protein FRB99_003437 [Tulasnella sp. 403]
MSLRKRGPAASTDTGPQPSKKVKGNDTSIPSTTDYTSVEQEDAKEQQVGRDLHRQVFEGDLTSTVLKADDSSGNVLALSQPKRRNPVILSPTERQGFELAIPEEFQNCFGICPDADQAIRWQEARQVMNERLGTYQFMSCAMLAAWNTGIPMMHTAVDDLESFMWVLVWMGLKGFSNNDRDVGPVIDAMRKGSAKLFTLEDWCAKADFSEPVDLLRPLIRHWCDMVLIYSKPMRTRLSAHPKKPTDAQERSLLQEIKRLSLATYKAYLESGFKYLASLRALKLDGVLWQDTLSDDQQKAARKLFDLLSGCP